MNGELARLCFMSRIAAWNGWVCLVLVIGFSGPGAWGAEPEKIAFYVQLIRGDNEKQAPDREARLIGPKLSHRLRPIFKWENYWEISRQKVEVDPGKKARIRLNKEREVEIDLTDATKRTVVAYQSGKPVSRTTRPVGNTMIITGGDRDSQSVWFIVVRRDAPTE